MFLICLRMCTDTNIKGQHEYVDSFRISLSKVKGNQEFIVIFMQLIGFHLGTMKAHLIRMLTQVLPSTPVLML